MKAEEIAQQIIRMDLRFMFEGKTPYERVLEAIKQAQQEAYEDAARIAEREKLVDKQDETDEAYNTACEHIAQAIKDKAKELEW